MIARLLDHVLPMLGASLRQVADDPLAMLCVQLTMNWLGGGGS